MIVADYIGGIVLLIIPMTVIAGWLEQAGITKVIDAEHPLPTGLDGFLLMCPGAILSMLLTPVWMWRLYRPQRKRKYTER